MNDLKHLVRLSHEVGRDPLQIQGAGGNTSFKSADGGWITIKASGTRLSEMSPQHGVSRVDLSTFLQELKKLRPGEEKEYSALVGKNGNPRPSMELGFHAALPHAWVAHTHSIAGQISSRDAKNIEQLRSKTPYAFYTFPFELPGLSLSLRILEAAISAQPPTCVVLEHHGIIFAASDPETLTEMIRDLESRFRNQAGVSRQDWAPPPFQRGDIEFPDTEALADRLVTEFLFPDLDIMIPEKDIFRSKKTGNLVLHAASPDQIENLTAALILLRKTSRKTGMKRADLGQTLRALPTEVERMKTMRTKP